MPSTDTNADFNTMLKRYMPYNLLFEEIIKRDYLLMKVTKDQKWKGGEMQVPFKGAKASSKAYGKLIAIGDITENKPVLGAVSDYKELWGAMVFNDHDLQRHDSLEQSFIKILPDQLEEFISGMKETVSINLLNGPHICQFDAANAGNALATGVIGVDRPARLEIGQYVDMGTVGGIDNSGYVARIDMSNKLVTIVTAASDVDAATAPVDLTGAIAGDKLFIEGAATSGKAFTAVADQMLSAANGGSANLFGVDKSKFPYLQSYNYNGSSIDDTNVLENIFDAFNETRQIGKGTPVDVLMSYKHLANCQKKLEVSREYSGSDAKASVYGWTEIDVVGVKGKLKLVGINELDDDKIFIIDWNTMKLHSNGGFERRTSPDGKQFYEVRAETGYKYIVDLRFFGELVMFKPSHNGVIHSIDY
jgi:hypothetical protein